MLSWHRGRNPSLLGDALLCLLKGRLGRLAGVYRVQGLGFRA